MKISNEHTPPRWATRFLEWYCKPELAEDLHGDLNEFFYRNIESKGIRRARLIYIMDVIKFLRAYTLRNPKFLNFLIQWIMIGSYIKTSGRSLARNKLFSTINIIGLAISMSVGLLLISFINDMRQYDQFHTRKGRIFRIISQNSHPNEGTVDLATTSIKAATTLRESISGIEDLVILRHGFGGDIQFNDQMLSVKGLWAEPSLFKIFSFPLLKGNPETALVEPNSIVLTEKSALRLFGESDPMGKTIVLFNNSFPESKRNFVVTGILKDIPKFSHLQFEALGSFSTVTLLEKENDDVWKWGSIWSNYLYVLLPEGETSANLQSNLDRMSASESNNTSESEPKISLSLQPLQEIVLGKDLDNQASPVMSGGMLWFITGLSIIVLLSACINYTNLSIARFLKRSLEVGIRKVIGAQRSQVAMQFISEAVIVSLLSLTLAVGIFIFIRGQFLSLTPNLRNLLALELTPALLLYFVAFAVLIGIFAGVLPGFFYAKIDPIKTIKNNSGTGASGPMSRRKVLIIIQYVFSFIFITSTFIVYRQYQHFLAFDLGFKTDNILNINLQGNKPEIVAPEISGLPEVEGIAQSFMITSIGNNYYAHVKYNTDDSIRAWYNKVDDNYIPLLGIKMIAGQNFNSRYAGDGKVIVNENLVESLGIGNKNPNQVIGEFITVNGEPLQIVGVAEDFHYSTVDRKIGPFMLRYSTQNLNYLNAQVISTNLPATMEKLRTAWKKVDALHPLEATFYDDQIQKAYSKYFAMTKVVGFLALLTVVISSLGLLGMVVFTTETRLKEISIRKVFGAKTGTLIYLLSKSFLFLLIVSAIISLPLTYILFDKIILSDVTYRSPIGFAELLSGASAITVLALLMIGSQTLKVARTNPARVLKDE